MPYYDTNGKRRGNFEREREKKGGFSFLLFFSTPLCCCSLARSSKSKYRLWKCFLMHPSLHPFLTLHNRDSRNSSDRERESRCNACSDCNLNGVHYLFSNNCILLHMRSGAAAVAMMGALFAVHSRHNAWHRRENPPPPLAESGVQKIFKNREAEEDRGERVKAGETYKERQRNGCSVCN